MSNKINARQLGYLSLTDPDNKTEILIKSNKILAIEPLYNDNKREITFIYLDDDFYFRVLESPEEILKQLENIHPSFL